MKVNTIMQLVAGLFAIWALGVVLLMAPALRSRISVLKDIDSLRAKAALKAVGQRQIERISADLERLQSETAETISEIPSDANVAMLVGALSARLNRLGVPGREISTGSVRETDDAKYVPVTVTLRGPFLSVYAAMRWIESLPRLVRVSRARIERASAAQRTHSSVADNTVRAEFSLDVFFDAAPINASSAARKANGGATR